MQTQIALLMENIRNREASLFCTDPLIPLCNEPHDLRLINAKLNMMEHKSLSNMLLIQTEAISEKNCDSAVTVIIRNLSITLM